jgi:PAS domain S-box-containing protein
MKDTSSSVNSSANLSAGSDRGLSGMQNLLNFSPDVICALDKEGRFLYLNAAAKTDWGYDPADLIGSSLLDHVAEADRLQTGQMLTTARNSLVSTRFQNGFRCKDGTIKPTLWSVSWNAKEEVLYGVARDGSEAVAAKEKAKNYEQRLYRAYKLAKLGWWEWNIHGEQIDAADELYELYGISKAEHPVFSTGVYLSLVHPDDLSFVLENVAIFWKTPYHQYQHRIQKPSGEVIYVELNVQTVKDANNHVIQVHGTAKDITEQKKYEKERSALDLKLQQANENLLMALETMSDGFCTTDRNWTFSYMNQKAAAMLGHAEKGNYFGKNLWACFPEAVGTRFYTEYNRAAAENTFVLIEEYYAPLNTWFEVNVYPNANGLSFYMKDISQRKQQERELILSNERFHLVAQATSEAIWDWNIENQQVELGEGFYTLFGYHFDELRINLDSFIECIHPDDKEKAVEVINKAITGTEKKWVNEFRFRKADHSYAYVVDKGVIIRDEHHKALRMVGAIQDITGQKKQEERLEFMAKATSEVIWERDIHSEEVFINAEKFKELFGYEVTNNFILRSFWLARIHPDDIPVINSTRTVAIEKGQEFYIREYRFKKADGNWAYVKERTCLIKDFNGQPVSFIGAMEDITRERLSEKALQESEESYRQLFNNAPLPTIISDVASLRILDVNNAIIEQYGYSRKELLSMTVLDLHPKEEHGRFFEANEKIKPSARNNLGAIQHLKKNRERMQVEVSATPIQYKGNAAMLATAHNITEKLRLQKQLIEEKVNHQKSITKVTIEAQEKQRSEIGKELHDNVNQLLTVAKLYVENIRHVAEQRDYFIEQSIALLSRSINETRRLSHVLVTPAVKDAGLQHSLLALIETFQELKTFAIHTVFDFDEEQVEAGLVLTIYRILQECFSNTVKYANASVVSVIIRLHHKKLLVTYTDNGVAFVPSAVKKGIGLKNIINRAEAYRGKVKIKASQNGGFELNVSFPLGN